MWNHLLPIFHSRIGFRSFHELEVGSIIFIGDNVKIILKVIDIVFESACPRLKHLKFPIGIIGIQNSEFRGKGAIASNHQIFFRFGFVHVSSESFVFFRINQLILFGLGSYGMLKNTVGPKRLIIFSGIKKCFIVIGPSGAPCGVGDFIL